MEKMIYVLTVETTDGNGITLDGYTDYVGFDLEIVRRYAKGAWEHLTEGEKKRRNIIIEGYSVEVEWNDPRSARMIYEELLDRWEKEIQNPVYSETFTAPYSVHELIEMARTLEAEGLSPADIDADGLNKYARADRGELTQDDMAFVLDRLAKLTE